MSHDVIRDVTRFGLARPSPAIWPVGPAQTLTAGPQIFESKHLSGCPTNILLSSFFPPAA